MFSKVCIIIYCTCTLIHIYEVCIYVLHFTNKKKASLSDLAVSLAQGMIGSLNVY